MLYCGFQKSRGRTPDRKTPGEETGAEETVTVTVQVETTAGPSTQDVCSVLCALLEDLSRAATIADVAIAAGIAKQELALLVDLPSERLDSLGQADEALLD